MKKIGIIIFICILFCFPLPVKAADYMQDTIQIADEYNVELNTIRNFSLDDTLTYLKDMVAEKAEEPLKLTVRLCGILLISAVIKSLQNENNKDNLCDVVCILTIFLNILTPLQSVFELISENLMNVKNFMFTLLPVFAGVSAASGEVMTSAVYSGMFLSGMVMAADICVRVVLPSTRLYFALIVSDSLSPYIKLKSISDFYLKAVRWTMRSIVSVVCFLLTVQTAVAQGSDTLAVKTGKVLTGTAVPVIGSVLQDAVGSVFAGMEAIKGFAGAVGIIGILSIFMPSLVLLVIYRVSFNILNIVCEIFDMGNTGRCIKGFAEITEVIISVVFLFITMLVFSLTVMIAMTNGV